MRDKNKLKKLLVLLSVGAIGLTPIVGAAACGTQKTNDNNNDNNQNNDNGGNDNDNQNDAVDISTIKDDLQSLVDDKATSWTVSDLQGKKLGDKTLTELGITVTEDGALSGTNTSTGTQHFTFAADGTNYTGSVTIDHDYTDQSFTKDDISVIQDDLSNLLNDSTMTTTEWTISDLQGKKLGGDSEYKDKTLSELGIDISQADHNDSELDKNNENVSDVQDYTFTAKESSEYFTKDTSTTITHNLDISVVADEIKSWLDAAAWGEKTSAGIDAVTDPNNWFSWASSNTSTLQNKTMSDDWNHGLNGYGFKVTTSKDADNNDCLKITFESDDNKKLGFNTSSDDDENSYILWSFSLPSVDNISTIKDDLQSLVDAEDKNDEAWDLTELQSEKLGGTSDNKDKTLTQLGITVTESDTLSGTNTSDETQKLIFTANGMSYSGSQEIDHNYTKTTFTKDDISVIQDDLSNLLNDSTMTTTEWTISDLQGKKLGGDSEYKDKTLSELGIDISQADHNGSEKHKNNDENVSNVQDYTFTAKESSEYFTKDTSTTITHNLDISVVADEIKSWIDAAAYGEKTSAGIDAVTDPDNWFSWASSNTSKLQEKTMSDVWNHALQKYGFTVSKSKDADGNDCLKITFDSDDYDLGFNASSDDDENSYILWSFTLPSVDNISTIKDDLQSLVDVEDKNDKAWDLTELQNEKLGGTSDNKDKTLSELGITVTESDTLSGTNTSDETQKLIFTANGMSYSGSQEIDHNYTKTTFTKDDISVIQDDLSNLLNDSTMTTTEWTISDLQGKKLGGDSEYKDKTLSELGIDISQADHNGSEKHKNNDENVSNVQDYTFTAKESSEYFTKDTSTTITHNLDISVVADEIKSWIDAAAYGEKTSAGIDAVTDPDNWFSWASSNTSKLQEKTMSDVWNHALQKYGFTVSKSKDADGNDCLKITFDSDDYDLGFNASSDDDENSYILWSFTLPSVDNISTIKDDLQSLVDVEDKNDKAWDLTELQNEKLGGTSDNKDKTLSELGITVTESDTLSGTNTSDETQKLIFTANGMSYSGSQEIDHNYTKTIFTKDDISVIQDDLKSLVESKTDSMWETTGDNSILNQTLGGTTEYKDKTLSELGIDVECLNPDAQPDENGLTEYNFKFTVNDSSTYLIAGTKIDKLTQNVLSSSDKSYYSIYLDADGSKIASNSIPDGTTTVLRLGTNKAGTEFVSIPDTVTTVTVGAHTGITSLVSLFESKSNLKYVDLTGLDTSKVTGMYAMFYDCSSLKEIKGIENLNTSNVTDMEFTFRNCDSLTSLNLSNWKTTKVTTMYSMFLGSNSLTSIDTTNWNTSKVTDISYMFYGCSSLKEIKGVENWDMSSLALYNSAFNNISSLECPDLSSWTVSDTFDQLDFVSSSDFSDLINFSTSKAPGLPPEDKTIYSRYIDADGNEKECYGNIPDGATEVLYLGTNTAGTKFVSIPDSVTKVTVGAHEGNNFTSLKSVFSGKSNLETVDFTGFDSSNVTDMEYMFYGCTSLTSINLTGLDTSNVTDMQFMFNACNKVKEIIGIENFDTSKVENMEYTFGWCYSLETLDVSNWKTPSLKIMNSTFYGCEKITTFDLSGWDTSNVTDMSYMFSCSKGLESLILSGWDTSKVTNIEYMFRGCYSLTTIEGMENWDMSSLTSYDLAFATNYGEDDKPIDGHDEILLECPDLSGWTVSDTFDQSDFISSSNFEKLIDFDISKAPSQSN